MNTPQITTIIPTYRRPELLKRAISSILRQTYPHFELWIYDNASGDETATVVEEFAKIDPRVKYFCHPENVGMLRNYACSMAEVKTPYFSFLSDDDVVFPWFFEEALQGFKAHPECAFSAASTIIMSEEGRVVRVPHDLWTREGFFGKNEAVTEMVSKYPIPTCILFQKKLCDEVAIDMSNALTWDCDYLLQIAARFPIFISKRPCGILLHHSSSYSNSKRFEHWKRSLDQMAQRLALLECPSAIKNTAIKFIEADTKALLSSYIRQALFSKNYRDAWNLALNYRKNYGLSLKALLQLVVTQVCLRFPAALWVPLLLRKIKRWSENKSPYSQYANYLTKTERINSCS